MHFYNIETPPVGKMDFHLRKNSLAILYRTRSLPTGDRLHQNGRNLPKKWKKLQNVRKKQYKHPTTNMPTPCVTSRSGTMIVAIQNPTSAMWDIYGIITSIGSHRRYFIKTQSGRILVRNRRFIRKRLPLSIAGHGPPPAQPPVLPSPRRSSRTSQPPLRLSEDPTWLFRSCRHDTGA